MFYDEEERSIAPTQLHPNHHISVDTVEDQTMYVKGTEMQWLQHVGFYILNIYSFSIVILSLFVCLFVCSRVCSTQSLPRDTNKK